MNRFILRHARPLTVVILLIFAWVVFQRISRGWSEIVPLAVAAVIVWLVAAPAFVYLWPRITVQGFHRAIVRRGVSGGPIPVNSLYAEPSTSSASASTGSLLGAGTDDVLYVIGWLDLKDRPQILQVPDLTGRYYSLQFTDPATSANFAYVGTRTTGTEAGAFLLTGPRWRGTVPAGVTRISAPSRSALLIGRVFVEDDADRPAAYALAQRLRLEPAVPLA